MVDQPTGPDQSGDENVFIFDFDQDFVESLKPFTEKVWTHCVVLFTWGQWLGKHSIEDHIIREGKALQEFLAKCENRYQVFCWDYSDNPASVKELLQKVIDISARNRGCFSHKNKHKKTNLLPWVTKQQTLTEEEWKRREQMLIDRVMRALANEPDQTGAPPVKMAQSMDDGYIPHMSGDVTSEYGSIAGLQRARRNVSEWIRNRVRYSNVSSGIYSASSAASHVEEFEINPALDQE